VDSFYQVIGPVWVELREDFAHFTEAGVLEKGVIAVKILLPERVGSQAPHVGLPLGSEVLQLFKELGTASSETARRFLRCCPGVVEGYFVMHEEIKIGVVVVPSQVVQKSSPVAFRQP
jgi:hypothetical protein